MPLRVNIVPVPDMSRLPAPLIAPPIGQVARGGVVQGALIDERLPAIGLVVVSVSVAVPVLVKAVEALSTLEMFRFVAVLMTSSPAGAEIVPPLIVWPNRCRSGRRNQGQGARAGHRPVAGPTSFKELQRVGEGEAAWVPVAATFSEPLEAIVPILPASSRSR